MLATGLFLISSSKFFALMLLWLVGVALVAGLFLFRRRQIHTEDKGM